ncbi:MAG: response regulator [Armatimonadota bacterium]
MSVERLKTLIVDDSPEDRETVRRYLKQADGYEYDCLEAETGEEAIEVFRRERPDVLLIDFRLPDMNGLELIAEIIDLSDSVLLPVVMLTGTGNEQIAVEAMKRGAQDYLAKGTTTPESLRRAIHYTVEKIRILRMLEDQRLELELANRELARSNRELAQADQRKDAFLAILAHELRNPLAATRNALEVLRLARSDEARYQQALVVLERQIRH